MAQQQDQQYLQQTGEDRWLAVAVGEGLLEQQGQHRRHGRNRLQRQYQGIRQRQLQW